MDAPSALILALASNLLAGAGAEQRLEFEQAAGMFEQVVGASNTAPQMAEAARLLRARALRRAGDTNGALAELGWLLRHGNDAGLRREAAAARRQWLGGGAASSSSPPPIGMAWRMLQSAAARNETDRAAALVGGRLREFLDLLSGLAPPAADGPPPGAGLMRALSEWKGAKTVDSTADDHEGRLTLEHNGLRVTLHARRTPDGWIFDDIVSLERLEAGADAPEGAVAPGGVAVAAAVAGPDRAILIDRPMNIPPDVMVRLNLQQQAALAAMAAAPGAPPAPAAPAATHVVVEATPEQRREIEQLIGRLGAADPLERARARDRLREIGAAARSVLVEHRNAADVEVAATVRELLDEIR